MNRKIIYMFSGQGAQYYQMGKEILEKHSGFYQQMIDLDNIAYDLTGKSVLEEIYQDKPKRKEMNQNLLSFQALFMVQYALAQVLLNNNLKPDYLLGTSMGEFVAVALAGEIKVKKVFEGLVKQCNIIESCCEHGSMIAIFSSPSLYFDTPLIKNNSQLASLNYHSHFVISGAKEKLEKVVDYLEKRDILYRQLPTQFGFHSNTIEPAASLYKEAFKDVSIKRLTTPIVSCSYGGIITESRINGNYFWNIIRKPIKFRKTILNMEKRGDYFYISLGPSGTLANFVKKILAELPETNSKSFCIMTPFSNDMKKLKKLLNKGNKIE